MAALGREVILADFQACTGIENIDEAITLLEQNNWDLLAAINGVIPQENGVLQTDRAGSEESSPLLFPLDPVPPTTPTLSSQPVPFPVSASGSGSPPPLRPSGSGLPRSASGSGLSKAMASGFRPMPTEKTPRFLNFVVEHRNRNVELTVEDCSTVGDVKKCLQNELQVPTEQMQLCGWQATDVTDLSVLRSLHLPKNNSLFLLTADAASPQSASGSSFGSALTDRINQTFLLIVRHREAQREYKLNFPGARTIRDVKYNVADLTNIQVRQQQWEGWPLSANNDALTLAAAGLSYPCHRLSVSKKPSALTAAECATEAVDVHMVSSDESDEFEEAAESFGVEDSEMFMSESTQRKTAPMMPQNSENEAEALMQFTTEFSSRYGECHPVFFIGGLEAALQEAFYSRPQDRKLLAVYLHHDGSVLTNVFCSRLLCAESVVTYLSQNFISWAWDVTAEANRARFLSSCTRHFGSGASQTLRSYKPDQFPLLLAIMGKRTSNEVLSVIPGNTTLDEMMMRLMHAVDIFTEQQRQDIKDEEEREARETVKREQDEAYRLSLEADRAKRDAQEKEIAEQAKREQLKQEKQQEKEALMASLAESLPPEPAAEGAEAPITRLRVRTPQGEFLERRFLVSQPLRALITFVASRGFAQRDFKLLTTFPRRDLSVLDPDKSFEELKLFPQETLFLEARN
ncbi:FAS-associated factor 1 [Lethenteron reissneri]|uniref:FAS-associated factor 1 n=1 Tax=Lethenteron reissneri TaxID=7753 RepID=UPI002AB61B88|nr:FAS-associated factor 1 [Lethenteron reissneri]